MSKPKYSSEFKIMIAEAYLNGEGGFQCIADKYGVGVASVLLWVRCYQHHGKSGFMENMVMPHTPLILKESVRKQWL